MKFILLMLILSLPAIGQGLSLEEQKRLQDENQILKAENAKLKEQLKQQPVNSADTNRMMEVLQRGKKYQEDQLKALEELEQDQ